MATDQHTELGRAVALHLEAQGDPKRANDVRKLVRSLAGTKATLQTVSADARQYRAALQAAEWGGWVDLEEGDYTAGCPVCGGEQRHGHNPDCQLDAALRLRR